MGLISPGVENLLDFLELPQVLSTYDGDRRDPLWWPQERTFHMEFHVGLSGFLSRRCQGLRSCVESVPETQHSSPVLTRILGYFWSLPRGVSPRLEWGYARAISSRAVAAVSRFPSRGSRICGFPSRLSHVLSHDAFPQGSPTCHRGVSRSSA